MKCVLTLTEEGFKCREQQSTCKSLSAKEKERKVEKAEKSARAHATFSESLSKAKLGASLVTPKTE